MAAIAASSFVGVRVADQRSARRAAPRATSVRATAAAFTKVTTLTELKAKGGRVVAEQVLVQQVGDDVFCVSNKCSHLGLSMQGKTALLSAKVDCSSGPCAIVCPAHGTAFDLATGAVKGEWCPGMPDLPFVGKMKPPAPLPVFTVQVDGDAVSVSV